MNRLEAKQMIDLFPAFYAADNCLDIFLAFAEGDRRHLGAFLDLVSFDTNQLLQLLDNMIEKSFDLSIINAILSSLHSSDDNLSVMIVEDDQQLQRLYSLILKKFNINILQQSYTGKQAVDQYLSLNTKPDIILLDFRLPDFNGSKVAEEILKVESSQKIIFVTAERNLNKTLPLELQKIPLIEKPFEFDKLVNKLCDLNKN